MSASVMSCVIKGNVNCNPAPKNSNRDCVFKLFFLQIFEKKRGLIQFRDVWVVS